MIAKFKFRFGSKIFEAQAERLSEVIDKPVEWEEDSEADEDGLRAVGWRGEYQGDLEEVIAILGQESRWVELEGAGEPQPLLEVSRALRRLEAKIDAKPLYNEKVGVAVPDNNLLGIKTTRVAYDCCTEELDDYLKDGWQIIAACPQPDQRRPDYILGHAEANKSA